VDQKYLESFDVVLESDGEDQLDRWCEKCRKNCYTRVKEQRNIVHRTQRRKANWIGHILRKNCFLKDVIEEKEGRSEGRGG
jgi:hypothetical protein